MRPRSKDRCASHQPPVLALFVGLFSVLVGGCGSELGTVSPLDLQTWVAGNGQAPADNDDSGTGSTTGGGPGLLGLWSATPAVAGVTEVRNEPNDPNNNTNTSVPQTPANAKRLLPWLEFCTGSQEEGEALVQLCISMQAWTDGVIVPTQPGGEWIFAELARRAPKLEAIPGARVVRFESTRGLDDPVRWEAIAQFVRTIQNLTGTQRFVLEVEYPLYGYWEGQLILNLEGLAAGLRRLPPEVDYVWYPAGLANGHQGWLEAATPRALALWRTIQSALPRVIFTAVGHACTPYHDIRPWEQINNELLRTEGRRTMECVNIGDSYPGIWPLSRAHEAAALVRTDEAFVWCPSEDWPALSAIFTQLPPFGGEGQ